MDEDEIAEMMKFLTAAMDASKYAVDGKFTFECPLCGCEVIGTVSSYNGHVHAGCTGCDANFMQ